MKATETELTRKRIHGPLASRWPDMYLPKIAGTTFNMGLPDKLGCIEGIAVGIEVKKQGKVPTKLQEQNLKDLAAAGGVALCATLMNDKTVKLVDYTHPWRPKVESEAPDLRPGVIHCLEEPYRLPASLLAEEMAKVLKCKDVQHVVPLYP